MENRPIRTDLFSSDLGAFSSNIWSLWMKLTVFQVCLLAQAASRCSMCYSGIDLRAGEAKPGFNL